MIFADLLEAARGGLALGCLFGLIAVGYSLVYGSMRLINFAHGEFFVIGGYSALFFIGDGGSFPGSLPFAIFLGIGIIVCSLSALGRLSDRSPCLVTVALLTLRFGSAGTFLVLVHHRLPPLVALILGGGCGAVVAAASERLVYRPMSGRSRLMFMVAALGLSFSLRGFLELSVGGERRTLYAISPPSRFANLEGNEEGVSSALVGGDWSIIAFTILVTVILWFGGKFTKFGLAVRAIGEAQEVAANLGVDVDRVRAFVFALGGFLAGVACWFFVVRQGFLEPNLGYSQGLLAFCAAVVGGIGRVAGALIGGIGIGVVVSVLGLLDFNSILGDALPEEFRRWLPSLDLSDWSLGAVYAVMIVVFLLRERGLVGEETWRAL